MGIRYKEKMTNGTEVNIQDEYEVNEDSSKCTLQKLYTSEELRELYFFSFLSSREYVVGFS